MDNEIHEELFRSVRGAEANRPRHQYRFRSARAANIQQESVRRVKETGSSLGRLASYKEWLKIRGGATRIPIGQRPDPRFFSDSLRKEIFEVGRL